MVFDPGPSSERRGGLRKPLRGTAELVFPGQPAVEVRLIDISLSGMGVVGSINPVPKSTCIVRGAVPVKPIGRVPFEVTATVAYSNLSGSERGFKIGLEFKGLTPEVTQAIGRFVRGQTG